MTNTETRQMTRSDDHGTAGSQPDPGRPPRVSIALPVYNGERFLALALDALLAQEFGDFEILIGDNASTDRTPEIAREYAKRDPRIQYFRQAENLGPVPNYNFLARRARGEFFRWASHDDLCAPTHLKRCVAALDATPSASLAYPNTVIIDGNGEPVNHYEDNVDARQQRPDQRLAVFLRNLVLCNSVFGLMRVSALRRTQWMGNYRGSDVVFLAELAMMGEIVEVREPLFFRRRDPKTPSLANLSPEAKQMWYNPKQRPSYQMVMTRLVWEHVVAICKSPIGFFDKLRCLWTLARIWFPRYWRVIGGEFKIVLKRRLGLHPRSPKPAT